LASASASKIWPRPRPRTFGLGLASISLSYYVIGHFSGKNRVKVGNFVNFSGNNLKSYVVNHYLVLFHNYFWPRPWTQPSEIDLGLVGLASASRFWPRLTSLADWRSLASRSVQWGSDAWQTLFSLGAQVQTGGL